MSESKFETIINDIYMEVAKYLNAANESMDEIIDYNIGHLKSKTIDKMQNSLEENNCIINPQKLSIIENDLMDIFYYIKKTYKRKLLDAIEYLKDDIRCYYIHIIDLATAKLTYDEKISVLNQYNFQIKEQIEIISENSLKNNIFEELENFFMKLFRYNDDTYEIYYQMQRFILEEEENFKSDLKDEIVRMQEKLKYSLTENSKYIITPNIKKQNTFSLDNILEKLVSSDIYYQLDENFKKITKKLIYYVIVEKTLHPTNEAINDIKLLFEDAFLNCNTQIKLNGLKKVLEGLYKIQSYPAELYSENIQSIENREKEFQQEIEIWKESIEYVESISSEISEELKKIFIDIRLSNILYKQTQDDKFLEIFKNIFYKALEKCKIQSEIEILEKIIEDLKKIEYKEQKPELDEFNNLIQEHIKRRKEELPKTIEESKINEQINSLFNKSEQEYNTKLKESLYKLANYLIKNGKQSKEINKKNIKPFFDEALENCKTETDIIILRRTLGFLKREGYFPHVLYIEYIEHINNKYNNIQESKNLTMKKIKKVSNEKKEDNKKAESQPIEKINYNSTYEIGNSFIKEIENSLGQKLNNKIKDDLNTELEKIYALQNKEINSKFNDTINSIEKVIKSNEDNKQKKIVLILNNYTKYIVSCTHKDYAGDIFMRSLSKIVNDSVGQLDFEDMNKLAEICKKYKEQFNLYIKTLISDNHKNIKDMITNRVNEIISKNKIQRKI